MKSAARTAPPVSPIHQAGADEGRSKADPTFRLILFRHGPAEEADPRRWPDDARRPLSSEGRSEVRHAARGLARLLVAVDRIATSPAARAAATAEALAEELRPAPPLERWEELAPGSEPEPVLARVAALRPRTGSVVVVGHAPTLAELLGYAVVGDSVPLAHLARGGAACVSFSAEVRPGGGTLLWLLTRKQLVAVRE